MTLKQVMAELKALGSEQTRKIYCKHGGTGEMFGVSYANINKMAKRIKRNQPLAEQLWATNILDAQTLATVIAEPKEISKSTIDSWAMGMDCMGPEDYFVRKVVTKTKHAKALATKWMKSKREYVGRCGYHTMSLLARESDGFSDDELAVILETIKAGIHKAPNRKREAMNNAVIGIGSRPSMKEAAIKAAKAIGKVEIDHGDTSCKTPDAGAYIEKVHARKAMKA